LKKFLIVAFPTGGRCQDAVVLTDEVCKAILKFDINIALSVGEGGMATP
jgi:hypothetical protein